MALFEKTIETSDSIEYSKANDELPQFVNADWWFAKNIQTNRISAQNNQLRNITAQFTFGHKEKDDQRKSIKFEITNEPRQDAKEEAARIIVSVESQRVFGTEPKIFNAKLKYDYQGDLFETYADSGAYFEFKNGSTRLRVTGENFSVTVPPACEILDKLALRQLPGSVYFPPRLRIPQKYFSISGHYVSRPRPVPAAIYKRAFYYQGKRRFRFYIFIARGQPIG